MLAKCCVRLCSGYGFSSLEIRCINVAAAIRKELDDA